MAAANITTFGEKNVGYVEFDAFGLSWLAHLIPSGRATTVLVSREGLDSLRFAMTVPSDSIESEEDASFVLGKWEVAETLSEIASDERLEVFDFDEFVEARADNSLVSLQSGRIPLGKKHGFSIGLFLQKKDPVFGGGGKARRDVG